MPINLRSDLCTHSPYQTCLLAVLFGVFTDQAPSSTQTRFGRAEVNSEELLGRTSLELHKYAFLELGYSTATSDQDQAILKGGATPDMAYKCKLATGPHVYILKNVRLFGELLRVR